MSQILFCVLAFAAVFAAGFFLRIGARLADKTWAPMGRVQLYGLQSVDINGRRYKFDRLYVGDDGIRPLAEPQPKPEGDDV